ncbi:MAG TPA: ATP-binding cassette domain-containing protein [Acidobacteriota bacterium]|nr:ATP-binding cassette domain-containing protein [Acidobacteriota bacterium]
MGAHLELRNVTFAYDSQEKPLFRNLSFHFPLGWTGIIGANGSGKTTLLRLVSGDLQPQEGEIVRTAQAIYCEQRTDDPPVDFEKFLFAGDTISARLIGELAISNGWPERWPTLSHGERKRAQLAVALWREPEILAVDEPTNHIDLACLDMLMDVLPDFKGIGLIVSHNRELLDRLCGNCLFIRPPEAVAYRGGYSEAVELSRQEEESTRRRHAVVKKEFRRLREESVRRREEAAGAQRQRSKKGLALKDHDARAKKDLARLTGKDGKAGRLYDQFQGRLKQKREELDGIKVRKTYRLGIEFRGCKKQGDLLYSTAPLALPLGPARSLKTPRILISPDDKIAVVGNNGSGKSTLIRHIIETIKLPRERIVYIPQEIPAVREIDFMRELKSLSNEDQGKILTIVSRLGSRPPRLLSSALPSPGEMRKLMLAEGLTRSPWLIVMDEPTNHMDLPSIEVLEEALDEVECALLLVSHDRVFLRRLARTFWRIDGFSTKHNRLVVDYR